MPSHEHRPRWSVVIPAYNCAELLRDSLGGVVSQDPGTSAMEILVVDDHSQDDCEGTVRALGNGRVRYYRQPRNVGHVANVNTGLAAVSGELVHVLHADDVIEPGFYAAMDALFSTHPEIGAAFCRTNYRDERTGVTSMGPLLQPEAGPIDRPVNTILFSTPQTSASVVRADVYGALGGFDSRFRRSCEDWEMWVRTALHYPVGYEPTALLTYRFMRDGSLTSLHRDSGKYSSDVALAHAIIDSYAPASYGPLIKQARCANADWILSTIALSLAREGKRAAALRNLRQALRCCSCRKHLSGTIECLANAFGPSAGLRARLGFAGLFRSRP